MRRRRAGVGRFERRLTTPGGSAAAASHGRRLDPPHAGRGWSWVELNRGAGPRARRGRRATRARIRMSPGQARNRRSPARRTLACWPLRAAAAVTCCRRVGAHRLLLAGCLACFAVRGTLLMGGEDSFHNADGPRALAFTFRAALAECGRPSGFVLQRGSNLRESS